MLAMEVLLSPSVPVPVTAVTVMLMVIGSVKAFEKMAVAELNAASAANAFAPKSAVNVLVNVGLKVSDAWAGIAPTSANAAKLTNLRRCILGFILVKYQESNRPEFAVLLVPLSTSVLS